MTQRKPVISRAVVWRPGVLDSGLAWFIGIGSSAIRGVGPFIAAGPITAALAGTAVSAATELRHGIAKTVGATGEPLGASAPQPTRSPYGPSACPLCCARH